MSKDDIKKGIKIGCHSMAIIPMLCGSSFKNKGVQTLLDAVIDYLPAPTEVADIKGIDAKTDAEIQVKSGDDGEFAGLAFKIMTDPFVGRLTFVRVYRGSIRERKLCV